MEEIEFKCTSCGTTKFEFDEGSGGDVCTNCGLMIESGNLVVLGRVLEGDDDEVGRNYVRAGGRQFTGGAGRNAEGRLLGRTNESNVFDYHEARRADVEKLIKRYLNMFNMPELFDRTAFIFKEAKEIMDFKWGERANITAAACVYIISRERNKTLPLIDLAYIASIDYNTLARAQSKVKVALGLSTQELDPVVFLDSIFLHVQEVFSSANPVLSGNPKKTKWSTTNLVWLRSLNMSNVRNLATGILAFTTEISLAVGRSPEQIACGVVLSSMEGIARTPAPLAGEILQELGHFLGCKASTMAERYREVCRALIDYAPTVPWIGEKGRNCNKRELTKYIEDIVKFRKSKMVKVALENKRELLSAGLAEDLLSFHNQKEVRGSRANGNGKGKGKARQTSEEASEEDNESESAFPDPFSSHYKAVSRSMDLVTSAKGGPRLKSRITNPIEVDTDVLLPQPKDSPVEAPIKLKRPLEYMSSSKNTGVKRSRIIELAASSLLTAINPSATSNSRESTPSSLRSATPDTVKLNARSTSARQQQPPAHSDQAVKVRKLLLAGHDIQTIYQKVGSGLVTDDDAILGGLDNHRLTSLLWTKTAEEITDEELFGPNELESFLRTDQEIELLKKTDRFVTMPEQKAYVERTVNSRGPYKKRSKEKRSRGRGGGGAKGGAKPVEEEEDEEVPFIPVRRTKAKAGTLEAMAAYFAEVQDDDDVSMFGEGSEIREALARQMTAAQLEDLAGSEEEEEEEEQEEEQEEEE